MFELATARLAERIPAGDGWAAEPKFDGYRTSITRAGDAGVVIRSRRNTDLTDAFPELAAAAAEQVPADTVLDAELVASVDGRLSFDVLQHRMGMSGTRAAAAAAREPATLVVFDVLVAQGRDIRAEPWSRRRAELEVIAESWRPPIQLTPYTTDPTEAAGWMEALAPMGIEGIVAKRTAARYGAPSAWVKVKHRETLQGVVGAIVGPLQRPEALFVGTWSADGQLDVLGRTSHLSPAQSRTVGQLLRAPTGDHPWPARLSSGRFGGTPVAVTHVEPEVTVEVAADTAQQGGRRRHPLRFIRVRLD